MSAEELSHWKQSIGQFISMNSFLSTSLSKKTALQFLGINDTNVIRYENNLEHVLFDIYAYPDLTDEVSAFANLIDPNESDEEEVIFTLGSVFKLNDIRQDLNDQYLTIVSMTLRGNDEKILKSISDFMKKEYQKDDLGSTYGDNEYITSNSLGIVLLNMGHFGAAERFFRGRVQTLKSESISADLATCYRYIGDIYRQKNCFRKSRAWYRKALEIFTRVLPNNDALIATTYKCLGHAYSKTTDWKFSTGYQTDFASKYLCKK
jgi:tetratricopeptide (TPR) repeat protein